MKQLLTGMIIGLLSIAALIIATSETVTCVEHVTIDNKVECALFIYEGVTYATDYAPIYEQYEL